MSTPHCGVVSAVGPFRVGIQFVNDRWHVIGGGLPRGTSWFASDSEYEAERETRAIADDIAADYVGKVQS